MLNLDAQQVRDRLPWRALIEALEVAFRDGCIAPPRHHFDVGLNPGEQTMLLMPAWQPGASLGVKIVNVFRGNPARGLPSVCGLYALFDPDSGAPLAVLDGAELTARRTAAVSALASSHLSRSDAEHLVMIGTGRLSLNLIQAHRHVRPTLRKVTVVGRSLEKARSVADEAGRQLGIHAVPSLDIAAATSQADIVSCATLSNTPLLAGGWLNPGTHVDLVGSFRPNMREADDDVVRRADVIAVDTRANALHESGDMAQPLAAGLVSESDIAELAELVRGVRPGRTHPAQITLFKSTGAAIEDLAAALLACRLSGAHAGLEPQHITGA